MRLPTALIGMALLLPLAPSLASADEVVFDEPRGDSDSPTTDVISFTLTHTLEAVRVQARLAAPNIQPLSGVFGFDVNGDGIEDYEAFSSTGSVYAENPSRLVCEDAQTARAGDLISITIRSSCLGSPAQVRTKFYVGGDAGSDFVPDLETFSDFVGNQPAATPTATIAPSPAPTTAPTTAPSLPTPSPSASAWMPPPPPAPPPPPPPPTIAPRPVPTTSPAVPTPPSPVPGSTGSPTTPVPPTVPGPAPTVAPTARLRISATPSSIRAGQTTRVCVRTAPGETVHLYGSPAWESEHRYLTTGSAASTGQLDSTLACFDRRLTETFDFTSVPEAQVDSPRRSADVRVPVSPNPVLRASVSPARIVPGQSSRACVRAAAGEGVHLRAYTLPHRTYRLVRSGRGDGTGLVCWNVRPGADTRLFATPADGTTGRHSASVVLQVRRPAVAVRRPVPAPAPRPAPPAAPQPAPDVFYESCDAARRAGAAPIYRGQPGYRPALDRDSDGVACE